MMFLNLLVFYHEYRSPIAYTTHYLFHIYYWGGGGGGAANGETHRNR